MTAHMISQSQADLIPIILIIQHFIPSGLFIRCGVIPFLETSSQTQSYSTKKLVTRTSIMIPYSQFQDSIHKLFVSHVIVDKVVVPLWIETFLNHWCFLFGFLTLVWQQVTVCGNTTED